MEKLWGQMDKLIIKKRFIINSKFCLLAFCIAIIALASIFALSVFRNLLADIYYQKYINGRNNLSISQQFEYIAKALCLNKTNTEYLYEFGKAFYQANKEEYAYGNPNSNFVTNKYENRLSFNFPLIKNLSFIKRYKNNGNPKLIPVAAYEESLCHNPLNAEVYLKLGLMNAILGREEDINSLFNMASIIDRQNIFHHYSIGIYYLWNHNLEKAVEEFREIFLISSPSGKFLSNYFLNILNQVYLINSEYRFLAKLCPSSYRAYLSLASFLKEKKRWNDSKKSFYAAIKLAPIEMKGAIVYKLAAASMENKDWQEVWQIDKRFKSYISSDKKINKLFNILLVKSFYSQKDFIEAIRKAELVITLDPYDYNAHYYKGLSLLNLGKKAEGIYQLEKAAKLSPENIYLHKTIAFSYESANQPDKALAKWELILELTKANAKYEKFYFDALNNIVRIKTKLKMAN